MLLGETVRHFRLDEILFGKDFPFFTNTSWADIETVNITVSGNELLVYGFNLLNADARLIIDGSLIIGGERNTSTSSHILCWGYFALPSGSHTITIQARRISTSVYGQVRDFMIRRFFLNDFVKVNLRSAGTIELNIPTRKTCLGEILNIPVYIICYAETTPTLTINNQTQTWTTTTNFKYVWSGCLPAGVYTINVNDGYFSVIACPWLLPASDTEIIRVNVPHGSTIYITATDLAYINVSKTIALGRKMRISSTDLVSPRPTTPYIYSASGTSYVITGSYTFEFFKPEDLPLVASGLGGAIAYIGVDVRT